MRRLTVLLLCETVATVALAAVAPVLVDSRADDPIAAAVWVAALGVCGWLLVSTVCCTALELLPRAPAGLHAVARRVTHPAIRAAIAGGLAFGSPTVSVSSALATDLPSSSTPSTIRTGRDITVEREPPAAPNGSSAPAAPPTSPSTEHRVVPGDNLWAIAAAQLATRLGRRPTEPEVARYWAVVVDVNRARVRSGDPDLIFPGEMIALPPL